VENKGFIAYKQSLVLRIGEEFEDTKRYLEAVSRRTDNTTTKRNRTNNDLQNTTQKTKDRTPLTNIKTPRYTEVLRKGPLNVCNKSVVT
jgi:hypothetical protein